MKLGHFMMCAVSKIGVCSRESFQILVKSATSVKYKTKKIDLSAILSNYTHFYIVFKQDV